ncbi:putative drug exporter of the RND superfamily [Terribacillus aidingensis]|uniref:Putative drug exporter of the RND superfamily n=1 Tax=Terribacillus aidingensis TaxID=586416 RepID=A0A285N350_9BACI|nr:MMPL family transporter [Terribacillus aidingensis]SNZ03748.1 putative drug exporter of the RND superfamily [Terribacillus aidingensis]
MKKFGSLISGKYGRWVIVAVWIVLALVLNLTLPHANSQEDAQAETFLNDTNSEEAARIIEEEFSTNSGLPALLTWHQENGLSDQDLKTIQQFSAKLQDADIEAATVTPLQDIPLPALKEQLSDDGTTLVMPIVFESGTATETVEAGLAEVEDTANEIFEQNPFKQKLNSSDLLVRATGPAGIAVDAVSLFSQGDTTLLFGTVFIVLIFLLVIYRSPILALIPLVGVGFAYLVISPILGALGKAELISFDSQGLAIMTVLLFGAGTDYCLFLINRFRENLWEIKSRKTAIVRSLTSAGGAIAMSGLTVIAAMLVLLVANYGSINRFAIPFAIAIFIMLLASLTLVPALLTIIGRASFFPFIPRTEEMQEKRAQKKGKPVRTKKPHNKFGKSIGNMVIRHPWKIAIATVIVLGILAGMASRITYTYDTLSSFPDDMPSKEGFGILTEHMNAGELAPVSVIAKTDDPEAVRTTLADLPYAAAVMEPEQAETDNQLIRIQLELEENPYSNDAMAHIPAIRKAVADVTGSSNTVWIGGQTAEQYDTQQVTKHDEKWIIPIVIGFITLLLLTYLRSVTATIYLVATVLLSFFSALGLGWLILHYGFGVDAIQGFIPLYAFVFIVALGEDYNIFMISSIWKRSKTMPIKQAIADGVAHTGGVITSAGLILAATFAVLTTLPIQILVHFGTITAIGVLLDTFLVRPFLVPAITAILGKWAFWPWKKRMEQTEENKQKAHG